MKISLCVTTFNEEGSIAGLLDSLLSQSKKPDEIIIVDGGSTDNTLSVINNFPAFAKASAGKANINFKLIKKGKLTRSEGRNLAIKAARNEIIAITDAGCIAQKDWLEKISQPFKNPEIDIVAGFYKMVGKTPVQKAMGVFLGVNPRKFTQNFLPSTRSMALRKSAWKKVGGFPETRENSAEDTNFNYLAVRLGLKYARVKSALVEWGMPSTIFNFYFKIFSYAKWDFRYNIWWHPSQRLTSHNIKALSIFLRYFVFLILFLLSIKFVYLSPAFVFSFLIYLFWAFWKVKNSLGDGRVAIYGPFLQIISDFAVMSGFVSGIISR